MENIKGHSSERWSPRGLPWPRGHILKSLALASKVKSMVLSSKPQTLENCPFLGSRTALFFIPLKSCGKIPETSRKICEDFIVFAIGNRLKNFCIIIRGGVEDTRLEAKAKDTKKIRGQGQGQPFRGQTLSRPSTGMLEAKAKNQGHKRKCSPKKKKGLHKNFSSDLHKKTFSK